MMEIRTAKKAYGVSGIPAKNQVCRFWLQGRCNRNSCKFMHRESPPPTTKQPPVALRHDIRPKQPRNITWKNAHCHPDPKKGLVDQSIVLKVLKISRKNGLTEKSSPQLQVEKSSPQLQVEKSSPQLQVEKSSPQLQVVKSSTQAQLKVEKSSTQAQLQVEKSTQLQIEKSSTQAQLQVEKSTQLQVEKSSTQAQLQVEKSSPPSLCKYWVTGNCVQGDKCKHQHSWFCGSGFTMLTKLEGHKEAITGISLPSASNKLFSGGKDRNVRVWDCSSGQCVGSVVADCEVGCLVIEGLSLYVGLQNAVKAWNFENNMEFILNAPCGLVCSMVVDEDKLFAGMEDGSILVWKQHPETKIPEPAAITREHNGAVCSLIIGTKDRLYSGSKDCTIKAWDLQNMQCLQTLTGHTDAVKSLLCCDKYLLSASLDHTLKVWSATERGTIEVVHEIKEDYGVIALCGIQDAEGRPILLCSLGDNTVRLYDLPTFTERGRIFSKRQIEVIEIGPEGLFFTGNAMGEISVWKLLGAPAS